MDTKQEISEFLRDRRGRLDPEAAGIPVYGAKRRVAGLRREEVALLAGVSVDYYTRIERGNISGASGSVLDAICRALQLTEIEREHLYRLAELAGASKIRAPHVSKHAIRPHYLRLLEAYTGMPAYLGNARMDILATNDLARALYAPVLESPVAGCNLARFAMLDPAAVTFFHNWPQVAANVAASLRVSAARFPNEPDVSNLIGELCTKSEYFASLWAKRDVHRHTEGEKGFNHPIVGDVVFQYEGLAFSSDDFMKMVAYTCDPASATAERVKLLASWQATRDAEKSANAR